MAQKNGSPEKKDMPYAMRFLIAGCAGIGATLCVHPLDVVRISLQLDAEGGGQRMYNGVFDCVKKVHANNGIGGLYSGLTAGMLRQVVYGMPRMAFYTILLEHFKPADGSKMSFAGLLGCGFAAGGTAAAIGNPAEVCLVRMAADSRRPKELRRNYKHIFDALRRIAAEEGVLALWRGSTPTVARACLLNMGQLGVYSQAKTSVAKLTGLPEGIILQFLSSMCSAVAATILSCPADVLKSRMQNADPGTYRGLMDCARVLVKSEGVLALWKGAIPAATKLAPHTVISFLILDNLTRLYSGKSAM